MSCPICVGELERGARLLPELEPLPVCPGDPSGSGRGGLTRRLEHFKKSRQPAGGYAPAG